MEKRVSSNPSVKDSFFKKLISQREFILFVLIAFIFIVMSITTKGFFTKQSMLNLLMSFTQDGIIAIGMIILLVSGSMDLSAGYNMAFTGVVTATFYTVVGIPLVPAIAMGLLAGLLIGAFNGFMVAIVGLNPFITTLGTSMTFHGLMMMITRGKSVMVNKAFQVIGPSENNDTFGILGNRGVKQLRHFSNIVTVRRSTCSKRIIFVWKSGEIIRIHNEY